MNSLYGHFSGRTRPCTHRPEWERERAHQRASIGRLAARDSLGKNVSKEVCFWLWGKDNLVQLPKRTHRYVNSGHSLFFLGSNGVSQVFCWRTFYKQGPIRRWICTSFDTERWSGPSYKVPGHDSELQMVSETASNSLCFVGNRRKCSSLFSSAHTARLQELLFSERIVNLYLSFINMIKLKTFWRYEGCSTTL